MIQSLKNIQSAFSLTRLFIILCVSSSLVIILFSVIYSGMFRYSQQQKIYVLQGEDELMFAMMQNTSDNREVEAKAQIEHFHELFFSLAPNYNEIEYNVQKALKMADNSAYTQYSKLSSGTNNLYSQIIDAGINIKYKCDSIIINMGVYPHTAIMYGKTSIERMSGTSYRQLITSCQLRNCARSEATPHGFLIEKLIIEDNSDIENIGSLY